MIGNLASALLWMFSTSFGPYLISRAIGGLSEGNVQLSIAIISDVSDPSTRARSLALVGIAFSVCFTLGPSLGAWFAMQTPSTYPAHLGGFDLNVYATPAAITFALLLTETVFLALALPETKACTQTRHQDLKDSNIKLIPKIKPHRTLQQRHQRLQALQKIHLLFLFFFSGRCPECLRFGVWVPVRIYPR